MRALSAEEYAVLRDEAAGLSRDCDEGTPCAEVLDRLVKRGCFATTFEDDEEDPNVEWTRYHLTPLGRLALRVSRPEMAVAL